MVKKAYPLFGSEVEFFLDADEFLGREIMEEAYILALKLQKIFNLYDKSSELSKLNSKRMIKATSGFIEVLNYALEMCKLTDGQYDISHGRRFLARKEHKKLPELACSWKDIEVKGNEVRLLHEDVIVDLGSIAKGYIADKLAEFFIDNGAETGYVDARGDIRVFGEIKLNVRHPRKYGILHNITLKDKGVATSGDYEQFDKKYSRSHILNQKDVISSTVVADSLMLADAYASMLTVCDSISRQNLINQKNFSAMIIDKGLNISYYNGYEKLK